jgi:uncharacterized protein
MGKESQGQSKPKKVGEDGPVFRCALCKAPLANADVATFPFCSDRCRQIDLANWVDGKYTVSRPVDPTDQEMEELARRLGRGGV